jgi:excisionase family DNA binding protein
MNKKQAAEFLGTSERAIERYAAKGKLTVRYQKGQRGDEAVFDERELKKLRAELEQKHSRVRPAVAPMSDTPDDQTLALSEVSRNQQANQLLALIATAMQPGPAGTHAPVAVENKLILTLAEAQALTNLSRDHLRAAIETGKLKARIIGRGWKIKRADLDKYVLKL